MGSILCCVDNDRALNHPRTESRYNHDEDAILIRKSSSLKHPVDKQNYDHVVNVNNVSEEKKSQPGQLEKNSANNLTDDHLEELQLAIGADEIIQGFEQYRNQYETDITFSKNGIISFIENVIVNSNQGEEAPQWELKLNKEDVKVYIKKGGSKHNADQPYIKTEILFNSFLQMDKVIRAIFEAQHRTKWDKNVLLYDLTPLSEEYGKNLNLAYQMNKSPLNMANKDFMDKHIKFTQDGKFYCYYSAIPNSTDVKPSPPKVDRALTFIGIQKMERRTEDNKIVYTMMMQCDLKMKITPKLITMFLPKGLEEWSKKVNKYMMDNYDKL